MLSSLIIHLIFSELKIISLDEVNNNKLRDPHTLVSLAADLWQNTQCFIERYQRKG